MMPGTLTKSLSPLSSLFADLVSHLDHNLKAGSPVLDVLTAVDAARGPLLEHLEGELNSPASAKALTLKILNLLLAKYHFQARSEYLYSRPFGLIVDPSNGCNLACPGCVHSEHSKTLKLFDWDKGMLCQERFQALLHQFGGCAVQIMFCNYGEPTANLQTPEFIKLAKAYLIQTVLSTNLTVGRFDAEAYVASGLDFMYLSIDGATQPVYERFRKKGRIDLAYENIRKLVDAKKRLGTRTPILRWQYLAFEHNEHEIPLALQRAKELGVDQFVVETPFDVSWDAAGIRGSKIQQTSHELVPDPEGALKDNFRANIAAIEKDEVERELRKGWAVAARGDIEGGSTARKSAHTCNWLYKNMVMDANGRVLPCCGAPRPDLHLVFANFPGEADCFNSRDYQRARAHFAKGPIPDFPAHGSRQLVPHCENCEWDHSHTEVGHDQLVLYLKTAGLPAGAIHFLADW
jgi:MoaA/NifB/PqqE/SkfB family radical SAM enzyme